jgi:hypothetical protein
MQSDAAGMKQLLGLGLAEHESPPRIWTFADLALLTDGSDQAHRNSKPAAQRM